MAKAQVVVEMSSDEAKLFRGMQKITAQQKKMEDGWKKNAKASDKAGQSIKKGYGSHVSKSLKNVATNMFGVASAGAAIGAVIALGNKRLETFIKNANQASSASKQMVDNAVAFAVLQEGGTKAERLKQTQRVAASYGVRDLGAAYSAVQSFQSLKGGTYQSGLASAETIWAANRVGVPTQLGTEIEIQGQLAGMKKGQALRSYFVAGQASARTPEVLATGAKSLQFFKDKQFGIASQAVLSGTFPGELATYSRAAAIALSDNSKLAETWKRLGVVGKSGMEKLQALKDAGIDTTGELRTAGLKEITRAAAIAPLVNNIADIKRIQNEIKTKAKPGIFLQQRQATDAEIVQFRLKSKIDQLDALHGYEDTQSPFAIDAMQLEYEDKKRGLVAKRLGRRQGFVGNYVDEQGRMTTRDQLWYNYRYSNYDGATIQMSEQVESELNGTSDPVLIEIRNELRSTNQINKTKPINANEE